MNAGKMGVRFEVLGDREMRRKKRRFTAKIAEKKKEERGEACEDERKISSGYTMPDGETVHNVFFDRSFTP